MSKTVSKLSEDGKVAIRNVRRDAMKQAGKLEKEGSLSEDGLADLETAIQELTDEYVKQVRSFDGPQHVGPPESHGVRRVVLACPSCLLLISCDESVRRWMVWQRRSPMS